MNARVNDRIEDVVGAWTRFQAQWWDSLFGIGKHSAGQPWEQFFTRPLEVSEDAVNYILQQQSGCIRIMMKTARPGNGAPRVAVEWADQFEKAAQHWVDAQRQAWTTWFAAVKQLNPYRLQESAPKGSKAAAESHANNVFEAWQQATQATLQAQSDWMAELVSTGARASEEITQASAMPAAGNGISTHGTRPENVKKESSTAAKTRESRRGAA